MSKEVRTLFLAILTLIVYVLTGFLKDGGFVFPFPLNDFIFLAVTIQFAYWHYSKKVPLLLFLIYGTLAVLANPVLWEILMSNDAYLKFTEAPYLTLFKMTSVLTLVFSGFLMAYHQRHIYFSAITVLGTSLAGLGGIVGDINLLLTGLIALAFSLLIKPVFKPYHLLWTLLLILEATHWITMI